MRADNLNVRIDVNDLPGIEMRLETEHENDWINIFSHDEKKDIHWCQFNEEGDLTPTRNIRIDSELAIKIWAQVEKIGVRKLIQNEVKMRNKFNEDFEQ